MSLGFRAKLRVPFKVVYQGYRGVTEKKMESTIYLYIYIYISWVK